MWIEHTERPLIAHSLSLILLLVGDHDRKEWRPTTYGERNGHQLAHALVIALVVFAVPLVFRKARWNDGSRFDWKQVGAMKLAVFILKLIWPA